MRLAPLLRHTSWTGLAAVTLMGLFDCNPTSQGSLEVKWSLESDTDSSLCDDIEATELSIELYDSTGTLYASQTADCDDFAVTIEDVPVGDYEVRLVLIDENGDAVSDEETKDCTIEANEEKSILIDFDETSLTTGNGTGSLQIEWSFEGETDASYCSAVGAEYAVIGIYDEAGDGYGEALTVDCDHFVKVVNDMPSGKYQVEVVLADGDGSAVTSTLGPQDAVVVSDTTTLEAFDVTLDDWLN